MGQKVRFNKEVTDFLNKHTAVSFDDGEKWSYIPQWYKHTNDPNVFEIFTFENLPDDFKEAVAEQWKTIRP